MFSKLTAAAAIGAASAHFDFGFMPPMPQHEGQFKDAYEIMDHFPKFENDFDLFKMPSFQLPDLGLLDSFPRFDQMPECPFAKVFEHIFGVNDAPQCEMTGEDESLGDWEYTRLQMQGAMQASFRGYYHSRKDIVSDECFGEWMNDYVEDFNTAVDALYNDPMGISLTDAKKYGSRFLDAIYRNAEACELPKLNDDSMSWCMENVGICAGDDFDWLSNIMQYGVPLAGEAFDLFKMVVWENNSCDTDKEYIEKVNRAVEDISSILSYFFGFDKKWESKSEHFTQKQFDEAVANYYGQEDALFDDIVMPEDDEEMIPEDMEMDDDMGFFLQ